MRNRGCALVLVTVMAVAVASGSARAGCNPTTTTTTLGTCLGGTCQSWNKGDPCCTQPGTGFLLCCAGNCQYDYSTQRFSCSGCGSPQEVCCPGNVCNDPYPCCGGYCASVPGPASEICPPGF